MMPSHHTLYTAVIIISLLFLMIMIMTQCPYSSLLAVRKILADFLLSAADCVTLQQ
jgi:hypothetical protein